MEGFFAFGFGHLIAFILPGAVAVAALAYHVPLLDTAIRSLVRGNDPVGPALFLFLCSAAVGLTLSVLRGQAIDHVFRSVDSRTLWAALRERKARAAAGKQAGARPQPRLPLVRKTTYSRLTDARLPVFEKVVENFFRYYQFAANMSLALFAVYLGRLATYGWHAGAVTTAAVGTLWLVLFAVSYFRYNLLSALY